MWQYEKPDNLVSWWEESEKKFAKNTLFWVKNKKGTRDKVTYGEIGKRIVNARGALAKLGVEKNDSVGIISKNSPEWVVLAYATYGRGARYVPMYEKELEQTWKYIITDSAVKVLLVSTPAIYEKVKHFLQDIPTLKHIYIIDGEGENSLAALEKMGAENPAAPVYPDPDDIAILIYTSGTTGDPKGVLLSHGNCTYCSRAGYRIYPDLNETQIGLSMLPWAHSYALSGELNNWIQFGGSLGFMEDVSTLIDDLKLVRPTYLISVPRVFNKIYDAIQAKMKDEGGLKKKLFDAACATAKQKIELAQDGKINPLVSLKFFFLDRLVFSKIRAGFGGRLTGALTASAVMNREVGEFFYSIGVPTYDCYGLSETSPAVTMNSPGAWRIGSVGKVLEGQKIVLDKSVVEDGAEDGEIVVYGPNVMKGYHNKPGETAKVIMSDGGFRTGDRGRFDAEGFLYITGRIKEQYKLENGKYVFPASIEEDIRLLPNIANAMVYGEGKPFNVCIVIPDFEVLKKWAAQNNLPTDPESLVSNKTVTDMLEKEIIAQLKGKYGGYEIPKKFTFTTKDFTLENGLLTQTMKLKRHVAAKEYKNMLDGMYS